MITDFLPASIGRIGRALVALHRRQSGTSLTEFAITLPVFMVLLMGILNVAEIQQGALLSEQRASGDLWADAVDYQRGGGHSEMTPGGGTSTADEYYDDISQSSSLYATIDTLSFTSGFYSGSYLKTQAADLAPTITVDPDPKRKLDQIVCSDPSFTHDLLDDQMNVGSFDVDNIWGIISYLLSATGTRPGLAAGLRYGTVSGIDESSFGSSDEPRAYQADTLTHYAASAPTEPTSRLTAVLLSRVEVGTEEGYSDTIVFGHNHVGDGVESIGSCP